MTSVPTAIMISAHNKLGKPTVGIDVQNDHLHSYSAESGLKGANPPGPGNVTPMSGHVTEAAWISR